MNGVVLGGVEHTAARSAWLQDSELVLDVQALVVDDFDDGSDAFLIQLRYWGRGKGAVSKK